MSCTRVLGANPGVVGQDWRPDVITYISRLADSSYLCLYNWLNIFVSQFQCAFPSGASFVVLCHVWHAFVSTSRSLNLYEDPVHTNALSNVYVFVVIENTSIDSRPHYRFYEFSTVLTKTFENDRIARYDVSWTLRTCYKNIRLRYFQSSFSFCCVSTVYTNQICMRSRFDPLSRAFSNQCVFDENAQRITEGLNASKCMRFQTKTH